MREVDKKRVEAAALDLNVPLDELLDCLNQMDSAEQEEFNTIMAEMDAGANSYEVSQENALDSVRSEAVPEGSEKIDASWAGYMELDGAKKDGDCKIVYVEGGISKELGCCNLYKPKDGARKFDCGNCKYEV